MIISLTVAVCAVVFSTLRNDLVHLPDQSGTVTVRKREEILALPVMDVRKLPIRFSSAAVLVDIEITNREEHALALCSEVTQNGRSSQLRPFNRLLPCGDNKDKQLSFSRTEENPHTWSAASFLDTTAVHFLNSKQLADLTIVHISAENHNSLSLATFSYTISASVVGPRNPLYWFHWLNRYLEKNLPLEKQMQSMLAYTKRQTANAHAYFAYLKKLFPNVSKIMKIIPRAINPQSCRSVDKIHDISSLRNKCMNYQINDSLDNFLENVFPRNDVCYCFFSGRLIVAILVVINVYCFFALKVDNVATTIIKLHSVKRLFLSMFAHLDWLHLIFNMRTLIIVGSKLVTLLDCNNYLFLMFYILSGLGGGVISLMWRRVRGSCAYCAGASGALYGISVVASVLSIVGKSKPSLIEQLLGKRQTGVVLDADVVTQLCLHTLGMDLVRGFFLGAHIDFAAHVGGVLTGLILSTFYINKFA